MSESNININVNSRKLRSNNIIYTYDKYDIEFTAKFKHLIDLRKFSQGQGVDINSVFCLQIIKLIDKYSFLIYKSKTDKYLKFVDCVKSKLYEFKDASGFKNAKELNILCAKLLNKYYGEDWHGNRCKAYKVDNNICNKIITNDISKHFCGIHQKNYPNKILKILTKHILSDVAKKCIYMLF